MMSMKKYHKTAIEYFQKMINDDSTTLRDIYLYAVSFSNVSNDIISMIEQEIKNEEIYEEIEEKEND